MWACVGVQVGTGFGGQGPLTARPWEYLIILSVDNAETVLGCVSTPHKGLQSHGTVILRGERDTTQWPLLAKDAVSAR